MTVLVYLSTVFSSLFRIAIYIFLRVIPTSLGKPILPALYSAYLLSSLLFTPSLPEPPNSEKSEKEQQTQPAPRRDVLSTLVFSLPTTSRPLRFSNIFLNTLLLVAAIDFVATPYLDSATDIAFTRVGAVSPDSVKIVVRYPQVNSKSETPLLRYREVTDKIVTVWKDGPSLTLSPNRDWVDTVKIDGLWPNTSYEYALFSPNRTHLVHPKAPLGFQTFPDSRLSAGTHFKFVVSSCVTPNFPYMGPLHYRSIKGFDLLADYLYPHSQNATSEEHGPITTKFMLFLGDFIYADVPVYIGDDQEAYRRLYRRNYQSDSFRKIYERLPIFHAYDDHEFINNFGASGDDSTPPYMNASSAFRLYNSDANYDPILPDTHYYEFNYGDSAFFVLDTRRYRTAMGTPNRTMLGDTQLASLHEWLSRVNETSTFKFIVTSVPFTSLWGHDAQSDSWAGFPEEKQALLSAFHSVPNVVLLSGDRHEFAAIEFTSPNPGSYPVIEFSTSPLNMFYIPFVRTLQMQSDISALKERVRLVSTENGTEFVNFVEEIPLERVIKYIPTGNSKWSTLEIDSTNSTSPKLRLEAVIDGLPGFSYEMAGIPVKLQTSTAISAYIVGGVKDFMDKFGIQPSKWF